MASLSYKIVLELDNQDPQIFEKSMGLKGNISKILVTELIPELRRDAEGDLNNYMVKNPELFDIKVKKILKVMSPGGPSDALVRRGDGTGLRA